MFSYTTAYCRATLPWIKGQTKQTKILRVRTPYFFFSSGYRSGSSKSTTFGTGQLVSTPVSIGCRMPIRTMSSDADYLAFLDKANAQREAGASRALSQPAEPEAIRIETVETGVRVPEVLTDISEYYISETDELFEPVALKWPGAARGIWPEADQFASLVTGSSPSTSVATSELSRSIETLSASAFDPKNRYAAVLRAVRASSSASDTVSESDVDIKVYRMELSSSRVQYWILALDAEEGSIIGLRAKAVES